ncbi:MAG: outer membrane beta-barrel domain-containing protein [Deltaproteobacteria bacterium]|nr:outer membrane beta-barrel domain-containing protein [Deltaproteobacteria bacterium]
MKKSIVCFSASAFIVGLSAAAWAQDDPGGGTQPVKPAAVKAPEKKTSLEDKVKSVQRRVFMKKGRLELAPMFDVGLNDAFNQKYAVSAAIGWHFVEQFSLQANFGYAFNAKTDNQVYLAKENLTIPDNGSLKLLFSLNAEWAPLYGKFSLFAWKIIHFDFYFTAGFGAAMVEYTGWNYDSEKLTSTSEDMSGLHLAPNFGIGERFFITDWLTFRVELRDTIYSMTLKPRHYLITDSDGNKANGEIDQIQNNLMLMVGFSFFIPPSFEYEL